jgi:hypothetical protein
MEELSIMQSRLNGINVVQLVRVTLLALLLATAVLAASPASAAGLGLKRVFNSSASNPEQFKTAFVPCPPGKKVISAGATINGEVGKIVLTAIDPNSTLTGVTAQASETGSGTVSSWSVTAYAICADASPALDLQLFPRSSSSSSQNKSITAPCPSGRILVGVGGSVNRTDGTVALNKFFPSATLASLNVGAAEMGSGTSGSWSVTAEAICAKVGVLNLRRVTVTKDSGSGKVLGATPLCTSSEQAISGAGDVDGPANAVALFSMLPTDDTLSRFNTTGVEIGSGTTDSWRVTGTVFCVPK